LTEYRVFAVNNDFTSFLKLLKLSKALILSGSLLYNLMHCDPIQLGASYPEGNFRGKFPFQNSRFKVSGSRLGAYFSYPPRTDECLP
jgi:hypothetical protein